MYSSLLLLVFSLHFFWFLRLEFALPIFLMLILRTWPQLRKLSSSSSRHPNWIPSSLSPSDLRGALILAALLAMIWWLPGHLQSFALHASGMLIFGFLILQTPIAYALSRARIESDNLPLVTGDQIQWLGSINNLALSGSAALPHQEMILRQSPLLSLEFKSLILSLTHQSDHSVIRNLRRNWGAIPAVEIFQSEVLSNGGAKGIAQGALYEFSPVGLANPASDHPSPPHPLTAWELRKNGNPVFTMEFSEQTSFLERQVLAKGEKNLQLKIWWIASSGQKVPAYAESYLGEVRTALGLNDIEKPVAVVHWHEPSQRLALEVIDSKEQILFRVFVRNLAEVWKLLRLGRHCRDWDQAQLNTWRATCVLFASAAPSFYQNNGSLEVAFLFVAATSAILFFTLLFHFTRKTCPTPLIGLRQFVSFYFGASNSNANGAELASASAWHGSCIKEDHKDESEN